MQYLRAAFARASEGDVDSRAVELALNRTERGLQVACERVENSTSNNVVTLPAVKRHSTTTEAGHGGGGRHQRAKSMKELVSVARKKSPVKQTARRQQRQQPATVAAPNSLSPGQQVQAQHITHLIAQPSHPLTQHILSSHYGLPPAAAAVSVGVKKDGKPDQGQVVTGSTTNHLTTLPRANRRDAQVSHIHSYIILQEDSLL